MYMAYGWPQVIPLLPGSCPSLQRVVYLKLSGQLLLVVSPSHLELWGSSQVLYHHLSAFPSNWSLELVNLHSFLFDFPGISNE